MKKENNFKRRDALILFFILIVGLALRLYKINTPLADFFSWRQADTASVGRNFVENGFNLLEPKYHDLSNIQSGIDNPEGYRMVEFPLYNAMFAGLYKIAPAVPIEIYGRIITIVSSLAIILVIYYLLLKESGRITAFIGAAIFAVFPFFVFFSRVVLPDMTALALSFLSIFFLYLFTQEKNRNKTLAYYSISMLLHGAGLLVKPTVIFFTLPAVYLFYKRYGFALIKSFYFYLYFGFAIAPLALWRYHISFYAAGIPLSQWLITSVNTSQGLQNIFFKPAFFRWIFFERVNNLILGGYLTIFFLTGTILKSKKYFLHSILIASLAYLLVFQGGNVQHEYYQTLILPCLAIFSALGVVFFISQAKFFISFPILYIFIATIFAFSFLFSYNRVKDYYDYPAELVDNVAKIVSDLTKKDDLIVTDSLGDTTLLYLTNRRGSPAPYKELHEFKAMGYKYFVTQNGGTIEATKKKGYSVLFENAKFAIFKL